MSKHFKPLYKLEKYITWFLLLEISIISVIQSLLSEISFISVIRSVIPFLI